MATFSSIQAFERELAKVERELNARYRTMGEKVAKAARPEAYRAAANDLGGDPKFSGWRPWLKLQIKSKKTGAALIPTRHSAGPWTVAEFGRNSSGAGGGFQGPGINSRSGETNLRFRKSGGVIIRKRKARRWNGVTQGKNTASDALERFEKLAETIPDDEIRKLLRRHFDVS